MIKQLKYCVFLTQLSCAANHTIEVNKHEKQNSYMFNNVCVEPIDANSCVLDIPISPVLFDTKKQTKLNTRFRLTRNEVHPLILKASKRYGVPMEVIDAVIRTESNYQPYVISHVGAIGMMQLMPETATWLGVKNPFNPEENIMGGTKYLKYLMKHLSDIKLVIAAYNAGLSIVLRLGRVPKIDETEKYVEKVLERIETSVYSSTAT